MCESFVTVSSWNGPMVSLSVSEAERAGKEAAKIIEERKRINVRDFVVVKNEHKILKVEKTLGDLLFFYGGCKYYRAECEKLDPNMTVKEVFERYKF